MIESDLVLPIPNEIIQAEKILKENNNTMFVSDLARSLGITYNSLIKVVQRFSQNIIINRDIYSKSLIMVIKNV